MMEKVSLQASSHETIETGVSFQVGIFNGYISGPSNENNIGLFVSKATLRKSSQSRHRSLTYISKALKEDIR
jgi:hypothetical protein